MQARNISSWRKKPPPSIELMLADLSKVRFFVVQIKGPTNFILMDGKQKTYKVGISNQINCSCDPLRIDHCIHSLFCMVKVLKVSIQEPIVWQSQYSDFELADIVQGKYSKFRRKRNGSLSKPAFQLKFQEQTEYCIRGQQDCAICQDKLNQDDGLAICPQKCKSTYHLACVLFWIRHRKSQGDDINCPICRQLWPRNEIKLLEQKQQQNKKKKQLNQFYCHYCQKIIRQSLYICPLCQQFYVCQYCRKMHYQTHQHPALAIRQSKHSIIQGQNNKTLFSLISFYFPALILPQKKSFSKIEPSCSVCLRSKFVQLRKMPCGHFIDQGCLKGKLQLSDYKCSTDRKVFLPGLQSLQKRKNDSSSYNDHIRQLKSLQQIGVYEKVLNQLQSQRKRSSSRQKRRSSVQKKMTDIHSKIEYIKIQQKKNTQRSKYHDSLQKMLQSAQQQSKRILRQHAAPRTNQKYPRIPKPKK